MKKSIMSAALLAAAMGAMAQETYESAQIATRDLNGTARYVGMGGAMEALGADISTISSNPAGIGMFRRSWAGASGGVTITSGTGSSRTNADLNQLGFVISSRTGATSHLNFGFNYHKSTNFNQIMCVANMLDRNSSVNKLAYNRYQYYLAQYGESTAYDRITLSDQLTSEALNYQLKDDEDNYYYCTAKDYAYGRERSGYISNFDFNISGSINDRVYLGLTIGLKDVRYKHDMAYGEELIDINNADLGNYALTDYRRITGKGVDFKFGAIFRPVEESPFRFGLYVHTPTWYNLTCENTIKATGQLIGSTASESWQSSSYDYRVVTPWRFGVSLGHTFNNKVALGLTYEYSDYGSVKNQIKMRNDYYYDDYYYSGSSRNYEDDRLMNQNTEKVLQGVHLVKVGAEIKPIPEFSIRLGYNFESAMYNDKGSKGCTMLDGSMSSLIDSYNCNGSYYSTYDYTNWKDTHRITFGLGYSFEKNWTVDLSYQYSMQNGELHPFQSIVSSDTDVACYGTPTNVKWNRHQINCTISYRF